MGNDQSQAAIRGEHRQGDDEGRNVQQNADQAVEQAGGDADRDHQERSQPWTELKPIREDAEENHQEPEDRANREIDLPHDEQEGHPDRDDADQRHVADHVGEIEFGEESPGGQREQDEEEYAGGGDGDIAVADKPAQPGLVRGDRPIVGKVAACQRRAEDSLAVVRLCLGRLTGVAHLGGRNPQTESMPTINLTISSGVVSPRRRTPTLRPCRNTSMRSAIEKTCRMLWLTITMPLPSALRCRMRSRTFRDSLTPSAAVGSSMMMMRPVCEVARPIAIDWRWPPESWPTL